MPKANKPRTLLVVDDEANIRRVLDTKFSDDGYRVLTADNARRALALASVNDVDLLLTDLVLPDMTGVELLAQVRELQPDAAAVVITAYGTIKSTVEAMRLGASNYLTKPFDLEEIGVVVKQALEHRDNRVEVARLRSQLRSHYRISNIVGSSGAMQELFRVIERAADSRATVLVRGESGTGKELVARALHFNSPRADKPFVAVSCAALPESLLESELFGHEKHAFTGAAGQKLGRFELADQGTLFLDEIAEIPPSLQVKLLRVLQEREFERVGGTKPVRIDVRLVAATNKDLEAAVRQGSFREDLYYRLHVVQVFVPPLRDRLEDVPALAEHFLKRAARDNNRKVRSLHPEALDALMSYSYPGNVRELENLIESAVVMSSSTAMELTPDLLPEQVLRASRST